MPGPRLTTTSYALLALLRMGPFSAYELTGSMRRSALAELWPRTEASVYNEPRRLVSAGLATARERTRNGRRRTEYRITAAGRRAVADWLRAPGSGLAFECEGAVKAFFADATDLATLRAHLARLAEVDVAARDLVADFERGNVRFPDRIHFTAMAADLIASLHLARIAWAQRWSAVTRHWSGTALDDRSRRDAHDALRRLRDEIDTLLGADAPAP